MAVNVDEQYVQNEIKNDCKIFTSKKQAIIWFWPTYKENNHVSVETLNEVYRNPTFQRLMIWQ